MMVCSATAMPHTGTSRRSVTFTNSATAVGDIDSRHAFASGAR